MAIKDLWPFERKTSRAQRAISGLYLPGQPVWTPRDYRGFAEEGYCTNVYVYACVRLIAQACAGIEWVVQQKAKPGKKPERIEDHPLLDLLHRPNPLQGDAAFEESFVSFLLIAGNAYIERVGPRRGAPRELYSHRPDRMRVTPGDTNDPIYEYVYIVNGQEIHYRPDEILHLKRFSPTEDLYGLASTQPAARSIDTNNQARAWNMSLLQNSTRPPGVFTLATDQVKLTEEDFRELLSVIRESYSGPRNAGRPLVLEAALKWQSMGMSPVEMDWQTGQKVSAQEIAIAYGVPPELIGDAASRTYENYNTARKAFYIETVLPLMDWICDEFNHWLVPLFPGDLEMSYDKDEIEAIQEDRTVVWNRIENATWMTVNEKREAVGMAREEGGDVLMVPQSVQFLAIKDLEGHADAASQGAAAQADQKGHEAISAGHGANEAQARAALAVHQSAIASHGIRRADAEATAAEHRAAMSSLQTALAQRQSNSMQGQPAPPVGASGPGSIQPAPLLPVGPDGKPVIPDGSGNANGANGKKPIGPGGARPGGQR